MISKNIKLLPFFSGYTGESHAQLAALVEVGLATGTWRNKGVQQQKYVDYMIRHGANPEFLSQYDVLSFMVYLNNTLTSPGAYLGSGHGRRCATI